LFEALWLLTTAVLISLSNLSIISSFYKSYIIFLSLLLLGCLQHVVSYLCSSLLIKIQGQQLVLKIMRSTVRILFISHDTGVGCAWDTQAYVDHCVLCCAPAEGWIWIRERPAPWGKWVGETDVQTSEHCGSAVSDISIEVCVVLPSISLSHLESVCNLNFLCKTYHLHVLQFVKYQCHLSIGCPTHYRTQHFFNNSNTNEDIATKQTHTIDTFLFISHTTNVLLFKFCCNIFIGVNKEMPGSVASGIPTLLGEASTYV